MRLVLDLERGVLEPEALREQVLELGAKAPCDVLTSGAITVGRAGDQLAPMAEMAALGVRLFTDDGAGVQDNRLMRRAMEYARGLDVTLAQHCEDDALCGGGHMHEGEWSSRLGIPGQPAEAEELMVMRDIALARLTGCRIHFDELALDAADTADTFDRCAAEQNALGPWSPPARLTVLSSASADEDPALRADLLEIVKEVDERVERVFSEAFRDTAAQFERVFARLFPGGEGRITLTDPDDMLTTGI